MLRRGGENMLQNAKQELLPRLTLRIGVTGHRTNKLSLEQKALVTSNAEKVLDYLLSALHGLHRSHHDVFADDSPELRLVTSLAEGADTILAHAAHDLKFELDVILPFQRDNYARTQEFSAEALQTFQKFLTNPEPHSILELDGDIDDQPIAYLSAGRQLIAHSDILIAVWDGKPEAGKGGTAQILRDAVDQGMPVIWIRLDDTVCLVTSSDQLLENRGKASVHETLQDDNLLNIIRNLLTPPAGEAGRRLKRFLCEPERSNSRWIAYDLMHRKLIGRKCQYRVDYSVTEDTREEWLRFKNYAQDIGGSNFATAIDTKLKERWYRADNVALDCGHAYRSIYILNFMLASLAVIVGLVSVFWWGSEDSVAIKAIWVSLEVIIILIVLGLTVSGKAAYKDWHTRWIEARTVAELLRSAKMLSLIGNTATPRRELQSTADHTWVEWYVRATLREIGPPTSFFDAESLQKAIKSATECDISGQIAYNSAIKEQNHIIDHKLHTWGEGLFWITLGIGLTYITFAVLYVLHLVHFEESKALIKSFVTLLGAGLPALGAALFGIRAYGDYRRAGEQAGHTLEDLRYLKQQLEALDPPSYEKTSQFFSILTQVMTSDLRQWSKVFRTKELQLP